MTIDEAKEILLQIAYDKEFVIGSAEAFSIAINALEELKAIKTDGFTDHLLNMGYTKGYRKAIDDFAEKLMEYCSMSDMNQKIISATRFG